MTVKLYKKDKKGVMRYWFATAVGGTLSAYSGIVGKEASSEIVEVTKCEAKNVGKRNERSAEEQAIFECDALYKAKLDKKGYSRSMLEADNFDPEAPMLAHDYTKGSNAKKVTWGRADGQRKLNGVRCRIKIENGHIFGVFSRQNKRYHLPYVMQCEIEELIPTLDPRIKQLDGELYVHGMEFEEIVSRVKDVNHPDRHVLQFHWYDVMGTGLVWDERKHLIQGFSEHVREVPFYPLASVKEAEEMLLKCNQELYEGLMIRNYDGLYTCGERSYDLQKWKDFEDEEFEVVNVISDKRGHGVFVCANPHGDSFNVRWKTTDENRKKSLEQPELFVGKPLTVRFQNLSKYGVPIFPVGIAIRDFE